MRTVYVESDRTLTLDEVRHTAAGTQSGWKLVGQYTPS